MHLLCMKLQKIILYEFNLLAEDAYYINKDKYNQKIIMRNRIGKLNKNLITILQ